MSILDQAYTNGQQAAFEKFAAGMSAAGIRGAVPKVPLASSAAAATVPSMQAVQHVPAKPAAPAAAAPKPGAPAAPGAAPIAPVAPAAPQGWLAKGWGVANRVAANPVGQMAMGIGAPMLLSSMMNGNNNNQG